MSKRTRPPVLTAAQMEMLKAARDTGYPFASGYSGGRVNVFKALVRSGHLSRDGSPTQSGRAVLDEWSSDEWPKRRASVR
jgi:hypothetical protein